MATTTTATPANACGVDRFRAAIFEQRPLVEFEVNERLHNRPRYLLQKVRDGGQMDPHDDGRTLKMTHGFQAPVGYKQVDNSVRPLVDGTQDAQPPCSNASATFGTMINEVDPNACEGVCIVDFAQGFRFEGFGDHELKLGTPTRCIEELARMERRFVKQFLEQEVESFSDTAFESFDHHLIRLVIENGGANASVKSFAVNPLPVLTAGGWDAPPTHPVSIYFLEHYRMQIMQRLKSRGKLGEQENFVLEVEMTRDAWRRAKIAEHLQRTGTGGFIPGLGDHVRIDDKFFTEGGMEGRAFDMWEGKIRIVFNETPIRGFMRPAGADQWNFIRIHNLINSEEENTAGVSAIYNPAYDYTKIECDGLEYPVIELIPHIHDDSFVRYGLTKAIGPDGVNAHGNTFEVRLLKDDALSSKDCPNDFNTYYNYRARHNFRFRDVYPEFSGYIAHVHTILEGYDIEPTGQCLQVREGEKNIDPEVLDNCNDRGCYDENCPDPDTEGCVGDGSDNVTTLTPCGVGQVGVLEAGQLVFLTFDRDERCANVDSQVQYSVTSNYDTAPVLFTVVDEAGVPLPATGDLDWVSGESGTKQVCIRIDGFPADAQVEGAPAPTITLAVSGVNGTTIPGCQDIVITLQDRADGALDLPAV